MWTKNVSIIPMTGLQNDLIARSEGKLQDVICVGPTAGVGGFGKVCIGRSLSNGEYIAIKYIAELDSEDEDEKNILEILGEHRGSLKIDDKRYYIFIYYISLVCQNANFA